MQNFLTDGFILANPALADMPKFSNIAGQAIYLVDHEEQGATGIALNRNYSHPIAQIAEKASLLGLLSPDTLLSEKVIAGGPLMLERPWLLTSDPTPYPSQVRNDSLRLNFDEAAFQAHSNDHNALAGIGTFGWGAGQLEKELASGLWHYFPAEDAFLLGIPFAPDVRGASQVLSALKAGAQSLQTH